MKRCSACAVEKPLIEFSRRRASPDGLAYKCRPCDKSYREARGKDVYAQLRRAHYVANREKEKAAALARYYANRESCIAQHLDYMQRTASQQKAYRKINAPQYLARVAKRRAALDQRTPAWLTPADFSAIAEIYEQAAAVSTITGVAHHVDHTIPLRGRRVSGLHVPANLQILSARENTAKGNSYEP